MDDNSSLDWTGQCVDEVIVLLDLGKPVVCPVILEVLIDLTVERVGQWLILSESGQQGHPVVKLERLLFDTEVLIEVGNDLDELAHDVWEERYTSNHHKYSNDLLDVWNRR